MNIEHALELQEHSWTLHAEGRLDDATAACREALRLIEEAEAETQAAQADDSRSLDVANVLNELAQIELDRQNLASALMLAERARTIERAGVDAAAGADADADAGTNAGVGVRVGVGAGAKDDRFADELAARIHLRTLALAGGIRRVQGDYLHAWGDLQLALTIAVEIFGEMSEETGEACNNLGLLCNSWGRFDEGLQLYERALDAMIATHGKTSLAAGLIHHNIGALLHARGDCAAAKAPARTAWDISRRHLGEKHPQTMRNAVAFAGILESVGKHAASERICRQALAIFERAYGPDHEEVAVTLHHLGAALDSRSVHRGAEAGAAAPREPEAGAESKARAEAEQCYRRALAIRERLFGPESPDAAMICNNLGSLLTRMRRPAEAIPLLRRALSALDTCVTPGHPQLAMVRQNLRDAFEANERVRNRNGNG